MAQVTEILRRYLGWCPNQQLSTGRPSPSGTVSENTGSAGPDSGGEPRIPGPLRVPQDMMGMLVHPVETLRASKNVPLSSIVFWYGLVITINSLILGLVTFIALHNHPEIESIVGPAFSLGVRMFSGEFGLFLLAFGLAVGTLHAISRAFGGVSDCRMTLRAVLYGATPFLLLSWTFWAGPNIIEALIGLDAHAVADGVFLFTILIVLWAIVLTGFGLREIQGLSTPRAFLAVALPAAVIVLVFTLWLLLVLPNAVPLSG